MYILSNLIDDFYKYGGILDMYVVFNDIFNLFTDICNWSFDSIIGLVKLKKKSILKFQEIEFWYQKFDLVISWKEYMI